MNQRLLRIARLALSFLSLLPQPANTKRMRWAECRRMPILWKASAPSSLVHFHCHPHPFQGAFASFMIPETFSSARDQEKQKRMECLVLTSVIWKLCWQLQWRFHASLSSNAYQVGSPEFKRRIDYQEWLTVENDSQPFFTVWIAAQLFSSPTTSWK